MTEASHPRERVLSEQSIIDAIDKEIIALVEQRRAHCRAVERARRAELRSQTDLRREQSVLGVYQARLGSAGTALAMVLLKDCRHHT